MLLMGISLVGRLGIGSQVLSALMVVFCIVIVGSFWLHNRVSARFAGYLAIWCIIVAMTYLTVVVATGYEGSSGTKVFIGMLCFLPLVVHSIQRQGELTILANAFVRCVTVLAAISLTLWIIGPLAGLIQPNCTIPNTWNPKRIVTGLFQGYFHLLYVTQVQAVGGLSIIRNTGIYGEAPMYAYVLLVALTFELFIVCSASKMRLVVLSATIFSTLSTTGIALSSLALIIRLCLNLNQRFDRRTWQAALLIAFLAIVVGACTALFFVGEKLNSMSGSMRLDDYSAGVATWLSSPIFGVGFSNEQDIVSNMGTFRSFNTGYSNTVFYVLSTGGVCYAAIWALALSGYFLRRKQDFTLLGVFVMLILLTTAAPTLFLTAFLLSIGVESMLVRISGATYLPAIDKRAARESRIPGY